MPALPTTINTDFANTHPSCFDVNDFIINSVPTAGIATLPQLPEIPTLHIPEPPIIETGFSNTHPSCFDTPNDPIADNMNQTWTTLMPPAITTPAPVVTTPISAPRPSEFKQLTNRQIENRYPKLNIKLNDSLDRELSNISLMPGVELSLGVIEGDPEFSPLQRSKYLGLTEKLSYQKPDFIAKLGLGGYYSDLVQDAKEPGMFMGSAYGNLAKGCQLHDNLNLGLGLTGGYAFAEGSTIGDYLIQPEVAFGGNVTYIPSNKKDIITLGRSTTGVYARKSVQGSINDLKNYRIYPKEDNVWMRYSTDRLPLPIESEINYKKGRIEDGYAISTKIFGVQENSSLSMEYENTTSHHNLFPDREDIGIVLDTSPRWLKGGQLSMGGAIEKHNYHPVIDKTETLFANLTIPLGKKRGIPKEKDFENNPNTSIKRYESFDPLPSSYSRKELVDALKTMPYNEFTEGFIKQNVNSTNDAIVLAATIGENLLRYNYDDKKDDKTRINTISNKGIYNLLQESLNTEKSLPATVCRGISRFMADMINTADLKRTSAYASSVERADVGHVIVSVATPEQIYLIDYDRIIPTGTVNPGVAHQMYQKEKGVVSVQHPVFNGGYIGDVETADSRLLKRVLTVQKGISATEMLKNDLRSIEPGFYDYSLKVGNPDNSPVSPPPPAPTMPTLAIPAYDNPAMPLVSLPAAPVCNIATPAVNMPSMSAVTDNPPDSSANVFSQDTFDHPSCIDVNDFIINSVPAAGIATLPQLPEIPTVHIPEPPTYRPIKSASWDKDYSWDKGYSKISIGQGKMLEEDWKVFSSDLADEGKFVRRGFTSAAYDNSNFDEMRFYLDEKDPVEKRLYEKITTLGTLFGADINQVHSRSNIETMLGEMPPCKVLKTLTSEDSGCPWPKDKVISKLTDLAIEGKIKYPSLMVDLYSSVNQVNGPKASYDTMQDIARYTDHISINFADKPGTPTVLLGLTDQLTISMLGKQRCTDETQGKKIELFVNTYHNLPEGSLKYISSNSLGALTDCQLKLQQNPSLNKNSAAIINKIEDITGIKKWYE
jgi:hypothetical protein